MKNALSSYPTPEVYSTFASVRLSQSLVDEAKKLLELSMDMWFVEQEEIVSNDEKWPIYQSRLNLTRLLIETGLFDRALMILETLEFENNQDPEIFYLFAWCYYQMSESDSDQDLVSSCKECLETVFKVLYFII
jgi:hypothetical protein